MNFRKTILYTILFLFLLIFVYNYILPYFLLQYTGSVRMGMHMDNDSISNVVYYSGNFISLIFIVIIAIVGLVLFNNRITSHRSIRCKHCGQMIESDQWKICPSCGSALPHKGDESTHIK